MYVPYPWRTRHHVHEPFFIRPRDMLTGGSSSGGVRAAERHAPSKRRPWSVRPLAFPYPRRRLAGRGSPYAPSLRPGQLPRVPDAAEVTEPGRRTRRSRPLRQFVQGRLDLGAGRAWTASSASRRPRSVLRPAPLVSWVAWIPQRAGNGADTSDVTDTCPRCSARCLVVEGYRDPSSDAYVTRAVCTSCSFIWAEPQEVAAN
jgi:hypothetical protein